MATEPKPLINDALLLQVEETAREQKREPSEIVEEALGRYLAIQRLERLSERLEKKALAKGIREEDIPRLVDEVRRENESRGR
jgi:hypothetical protein